MRGHCLYTVNQASLRLCAGFITPARQGCAEQKISLFCSARTIKLSDFQTCRTEKPQQSLIGLYHYGIWEQITKCGFHMYVLDSSYPMVMYMKALSCVWKTGHVEKIYTPRVYVPEKNWAQFSCASLYRLAHLLRVFVFKTITVVNPARLFKQLFYPCVCLHEREKTIIIP